MARLLVLLLQMGRKAASHLERRVSITLNILLLCINLLGKGSYQHAKREGPSRPALGRLDHNAMLFGVSSEPMSSRYKLESPMNRNRASRIVA